MNGQGHPTLSRLLAILAGMLLFSGLAVVYLAEERTGRTGPGYAILGVGTILMLAALAVSP